MSEWSNNNSNCNSNCNSSSSGTGNSANGKCTATATAQVSTKTWIAAAVYVFSGICQPLLMTTCKAAGLADSTAQLYMLFYYAGPSSLLLAFFPCCGCGQRERGGNITKLNSISTSNSKINNSGGNKDGSKSHPSLLAIASASFIATFDIAAQTLNYTGATLAGPTLFAVIYSSVTVWTALFSLLFCSRHLSSSQCYAIVLVVLGLCVAALDGVALGHSVARGTLFILVGSCMHGATYVMSEAVMDKGGIQKDSLQKDQLPNDSLQNDSLAMETTRLPNTGCSSGSGISMSASFSVSRNLLTVRENAAIQGAVACGALFIWQLVFTLPRWDSLIRQPMEQAGTTTIQAITILLSFGLANFFHSFSFYHTLAHYPGGSTSAGVMKGLQAVFVFVVAHAFYCSDDNTDSCFSTLKFVSLSTVVSGVSCIALLRPNQIVRCRSAWGMPRWVRTRSYR